MSGSRTSDNRVNHVDLHLFLATNDRRKNAFTLIEVLVATAILALVLVLVTQAVNAVTRSVQTQNRQIDSATGARRVLDSLEADLRTVVISPDASILVSGSEQPPLVFLSRRRGPQGTTNHRLLSISYLLDDDSNLVRGYVSVPFSNGNLLAAMLAPAPASQRSLVGKGILGWQIRLIVGDEKIPLKDVTSGVREWATSNYNGIPVPTGYQALLAAGPAFTTGQSKRVTALEAWIVALDPSSFELLSSIEKIADARAALGANPEDWRNDLDKANLPPQVLSSARVLNKTISLP